MADTFNENAYQFYKDGLNVLKGIKEDTEELIVLNQHSIGLQEDILIQTKLHLIWELRNIFVD